MSFKNLYGYVLKLGYFRPIFGKPLLLIKLMDFLATKLKEFSTKLKVSDNPVMFIAVKGWKKGCTNVIFFKTPVTSNYVLLPVTSGLTTTTCIGAVCQAYFSPIFAK